MFLTIHHKLIIAYLSVIFILSMYDVIFHFLAVSLHLLFESAEYCLDFLVEHLLETNARQTELIVFYVLVFSIGYGVYLLIPHCYHAIRKNWIIQRNQTLEQWNALPNSHKIAWWFFLITSSGSWVFLT